jgi:hypothetical protein
VSPLSLILFSSLQSLLSKVSYETFYHKHCKEEGAIVITYFWVIPQIHLFSFQKNKNKLIIARRLTFRGKNRMGRIPNIQKNQAEIVLTKLGA